MDFDWSAWAPPPWQWYHYAGCLLIGAAIKTVLRALGIGRRRSIYDRTTAKAQ